MKRLFGKTRKLMIKCLISYLLIIILPTILLLSITMNHAIEVMKNEMKNVHNLVANDISSAINNRFSTIEKLSESFHYASEMRSLIENKNAPTKEIVYGYFRNIAPLFNEILIRNKHLTSLTVYSENTRVSELLYEFESADSISLPQRSSWRVEPTESGIDLTYFCMLYNSTFVRWIATVGLTCSDDIIFSALKDYGAETWYLLDNEDILYSSAPAGKEMSRKLFASTANHRETGEHVMLFDNGFKFTSIYLESPEMYLVAVSQWHAPGIDRLEQLSLFSWLIALCVLMNAVFFLFIVRPLNSISRLSAHMGRSEFEPYDGKITQDEIGDLISSFNALVERTRKMIDTVRQSEFLQLKAQISALKAQIDPHFFYGTLESIRMIAEADGQETISQIAYSFSQLMRYSLAERNYATIREEIEVVKKYQDIQMQRLGRRIDFAWDVDTEALDVICPHFLLHPLVENGIVHGASKTLRNTRISIRITLEGSQLVMEVTDNGPGIPSERLKEIEAALMDLEHTTQIQSSENGRGILNVASRLQLYYGQAYSFVIASKPFEKTSVRIAFSAEPPTMLMK